MAEVMPGVDDLMGRSVHELATNSWKLITYHWVYFKGRMKIRNNPIESKCSITAERQNVPLVYHFYETFHINAVIVAFVEYFWVTVNDFHHFR